MFFVTTMSQLSRPHIPWTPSSSIPASPLMVGPNGGENKTQNFEKTKERIKKMFEKVELSVSSYDTAWMAMIPSPSSPKDPYFPQCLNWLLENQLFDGSWALPNPHPLLTKDTLLSTLACVLALNRWGVGEEQTHKGLQFIESNFPSSNDENQHSPIGFDIIFPSLIEHAQKLDLNLPVEAKCLEALVQERELKLKRGWESNSEGWRAYIAYISEGMRKSQNWEMVMKYQRKNGSLFNSPATTAAAFTHLNNPDCLLYLSSLLDKFGRVFPTVYPLDIYAHLYMVDNLERLGIDRHFKEEIISVLDKTYRCWLNGEEDIFLEPTTCAMAFRLLLLHGYDVSSDALSEYSEEKFSNYLQGYLKDIGAVLELYKAPQIIMHSDESILEEQNSWTRHLLKQELSLFPHYEVNEALQFPHHANLDRLLNRSCIEHFNVDHTRILKTSYRCLNFANEDFLHLAVEEFNVCQSQHQDEYEQYKRWIVESKLEKLEFPKQKLVYCYLSGAATLVSPELSEARLSWAKNGLLTTIVDDLFDVWGSEEEQINLVQLVHKWRWNVDVSRECCSERVEILFSAIQSTVCDTSDKARKVQGRSVKAHLIQLWLELLESGLKEANWSRTKTVPSFDEYMGNGYVSFALGPVILPSLYLVGPKLSKDTIQSTEYNRLFQLTSICGRLLNDINGFQREFEQGKLNALTVLIIHGSGAVKEEEIKSEIKDIVNEKRRELLRLVLQTKGSVVPRACKDVFWKMAKVVHMFYMKDDGYNSHGMLNLVDAVLKEPIAL